ncbi:hypothetical protein H4R19_002402 [Coemansia spiralis]|nr:hypothetical protein H4R19_002402 [Coemansia spiralis]
MADKVFAMPVDSEFVLVQGRVARNNRLRRMSDASMPSTMSTLAPRQPGRRRNTVSTAFIRDHSASLPSEPQIRRATVLPGPMASPAFGFMAKFVPVPPLTLGLPATPPLPSLPEDDDLSLGMSSCGSLLTDDVSMDFPPLTPPLSPVPREAVPQKTLRYAASLPTMLPAIPEHAAAPASPTCGEPPMTAPAAGRPYDRHADDVTCILLDNKKILLARPRLVHISPPITA